MANATIKVTRKLAEGKTAPYATLLIDRDHQIATVWRHRERQVHCLTLVEVVDMIEARAVKQAMGDAAAALAPRKIRRGGR